MIAAAHTLQGIALIATGCGFGWILCSWFQRLKEKQNDCCHSESTQALSTSDTAKFRHTVQGAAGHSKTSDYDRLLAETESGGRA